MAISVEDRERIEAFRTYIEDSLATDDRYGAVVRRDDPNGQRLSSRWTVAPSCWFEVTLILRPARIMVSYLTDDAARNEVVESAIRESGQKTDIYVGEAFQDAGLDWPTPPVERGSQQGLFTFATSLNLEELRDLEDDEIRDRVLRALEGFMIAFAPALAVEDVAD